jgi:hypothetical protein
MGNVNRVARYDTELQFVVARTRNYVYSAPPQNAEPATAHFFDL